MACRTSLWTQKYDIRIRYIMEYFYIQIFQILRDEFYRSSLVRFLLPVRHGYADIRLQRSRHDCRRVAKQPLAALSGRHRRTDVRRDHAGFVATSIRVARRAWRRRYRVVLARDRAAIPAISEEGLGDRKADIPEARPARRAVMLASPHSLATRSYAAAADRTSTSQASHRILRQKADRRRLGICVESGQ